MVYTKMRSKSVYSKGAHWEEQGLNPGFNFFLCLREKEVFFSFSFFFSFFFFSLFFFLFPFFFSVVQPRLAPGQTCRLVPIGMFDQGPTQAKAKKKKKKKKGKKRKKKKKKKKKKTNLLFLLDKGKSLNLDSNLVPPNGLLRSTQT